MMDVIKEFKVIGKRLPSHDAVEKATGQTKYADDFALPGMIYGKILRAKYPHARIKRIDTSKAEKLDGVYCVLTHKDVPNNAIISRFGQTRAVGGFEGVYRVLAEGKVRYYGEPVALVAAETEEIAEKAIDLIEVEYEELEGVFDPREAMDPKAPKIEDGKSNVVARFKIRKGDVAKGFAEADVIVENEYMSQFIDHAYLEPEAGVAWVEDDGSITIRVSTQVIEHYREIAHVLGIPESRVRVITPKIGGGFGGKEDITVEYYLALLAWKTGRPVKIVQTREESLSFRSKRHPYKFKYKTGVKKDGTIVAVEAELISDAGAYMTLSPWVLLYSTVNAIGPYNVPNVKVDSYTVLTNHPPSGAYRTFGAGQACVAYEQQMDEVAKKLGMDPVEFRKKNYLKKGDTMANGWKIPNTVALHETTDLVLKYLGKKPKPSGPKKLVGMGIASGMCSYGRMIFLHDTSRSKVRLELDGSVTIECGVQDVGAGQEASLCQIVSEVLGVPLKKIRIISGDTAATPIAGTTTATRQLYMSGNATYLAAMKVRDNILTKASEIFGVDKSELIIEDEKIKTKDGKSISLRDIAVACAADGVELFYEAQFNAPFGEVPDPETGQGRVFPDFTYGTAGAIVEIDTETGEVEVKKIASAFDVGTAINPMRVEGQIEGGAAMGIGWALTEDVKFEKGIAKAQSFAEYIIATAVDVPEIKSIIVENHDGLGPFGARGVGEVVLAPVPPAVINAVADALGKRIKELPITGERILLALREKS